MYIFVRAYIELVSVRIVGSSVLRGVNLFAVPPVNENIPIIYLYR